MTVLRPFFSFYGSKWRLAPRYPEPKHSTIVEPFAGSAGYSLRYPERDVILVERDPVIAELWRYLIKTDADEIRALPLLGPHDSVTDLALSDGARALIGFWINRACDRPRVTPGKWMRESAAGSLWWGFRSRERVASQVDAIRHWTVIEGDYSDAPDVAATWFIDPPYQLAGRHYRYGSPLIDFDRLGQWCRGRSGQVMVCENDGAAWLPFRPFRSAFGAAKHHSMEVLWAND